MGFFNLFLFIIIFHVFVTTPIFSHSNNNERSSSSISNFLDLAKSPEVFDWMVRIRRKIHEYPELLYEEFNTSEVIRTELDKMGISYKHPVAETGVIGYIGTRKPPFVAIRADIDGLPIQEMVEWEHKSKVDGKMHACAHDAHTAMLLGAAKILKHHEDQIKVITGVATVHRCTAEVDFQEEQKPFYPATINDEKLHEHFLEVAKNVVGNENVYETQPVTVSEDFAFYQEVIPGYFFMLGFKSLTSVEPLPMLHSPHFTVNEDAFPYGAALHASLATTFLLNLDDGGKCHDEL
ncbi:IAA-amino acid hydrolase ILR1-like [Arachis hypogaea]|nr:IAA-amino acid hydrolase ILR1-like [Arachis hypogaea]